MSNKLRPLASEPYLTVAQAAELFSVHPSTIRRWIDRGRLPAYRIGEKRIGVRRSDLARLVTPRLVGTGQGGNMAQSHRLAISPLSKEEQRRGMRAVAELERLSTKIAARHGELTPESWELANASRDERAGDVARAVEE